MLRALGSTAAMVAAGTALGACAAGQKAQARPAAQANITKVTFQLYVVGIPINATTTKLIQDFVDQEFNRKHKGVDATWQKDGDMTAVVAAILSGAPAPVSLASLTTDWPIILPFLEPLDAYLRQDNVDASIWPPNLLAELRVGGHLYAVPVDAASQAYLYRQDILDELGLPYPDPGWTYLDAQRLWSRCTSVKGGQQRSGGTIPWSAGGPFPGIALLAGFGGAYLDSTYTRCLLDEPGSIAAGEFAFDLLWRKVCVQGDGTPVPGLATGQVVFSQGADPSLLWAVQNLGTATKWDFIPYPRWPVRPATVGQSSWYCLNGFAPNKELAWELFKFSAVDTAWSRFYMRLGLAPPNQPGLLEEWETVVRSVAPILRGKALRYWVRPAQAGEAYPGFEFFKYQPVEAGALVSQTWGKIWNQQLGVSEGFKSIARQIDALQGSGTAESPQPTAAQRVAAAAAVRRKFPALGPGIAPVIPGL